MVNLLNLRLCLDEKFNFAPYKQGDIMKILSFILIVSGAVLVFMFDNEETWHIYLKILGFVMMMYGLYRSTVLWVKDNPRDDNSDAGQNGELQ